MITDSGMEDTNRKNKQSTPHRERIEREQGSRTEGRGRGEKKGKGVEVKLEK